MSEAYRVEVDSDGCDRCQSGKSWTVVGPDGVAFGVSYDDYDNAVGLADMLNVAYEAGRLAPPAVPSPAPGA